MKRNLLTIIIMSVFSTANAATVLGSGATASGVYSTAVGDNTVATGTHSTALGDSANAKGYSTIAIGENATSDGSRSGIAIGQKANVGGESSIAIGTNASTTGKTGISLGNDTIASSMSLAMGASAQATGASSVSIGRKSSATQQYSVVLGSGSTDAQTFTTETSNTQGGLTYNYTDGGVLGQVSVGNATEGFTRQIKQVAAGAVTSTSTDAINGSQLNAVQQTVGNLANSVVNVIGSDVTLDSTGKLTATNIAGTGMSNLSDAIKQARSSVSTSDSNLTVVETESNGKKNYDLTLSKDLTLNSVTTTTLTADTVNVGSTSLSANGLNNGGNTITNVAAGVNGTDAVNVNQLNALNTSLNQETDNKIAKAMSGIDSKISKFDKDAKAGVAQALATAGLMQAYKPNQNTLSVGVGSYGGQTAWAAGFSGISEKGKWGGKVTVSIGSNHKVGGSLSGSYHWE